MPEIQMYRCPKCKELYADVEPGGVLTYGAGARKFPPCPKCKLPGKYEVLRMKCDLSSCGKEVDQVPDSEGWHRISLTAFQWQFEKHWQGAELVQGDKRGNKKAGNFKPYPTCPYNLMFCSFDHIAPGLAEKWGELEAVNKKWQDMR